jgi:hypothetical protein
MKRLTYSSLCLLGSLVLGLLMATSPSFAKKKVTIPINVGLGPAAYFITGDIQNDQAPHYGVKINLGAVITKKTIEENKGKIPKKYHSLVDKVGEAQIGHLLIPDALFISPKTQNTGIYGVTWQPININQPLLDSWLKLEVGAGLLLSYAYIDQDIKTASGMTTNQTTHFFRPGLELLANLDLPFSDSFILSLGWSSGFYVPQTLGEFTGVSVEENSIWHIGQAYALFNFRFPFTAKI